MAGYYTEDRDAIRPETDKIRVFQSFDMSTLSHIRHTQVIVSDNANRKMLKRKKSYANTTFADTQP